MIVYHTQENIPKFENLFHGADSEAKLVKQNEKAGKYKSKHKIANGTYRLPVVEYFITVRNVGIKSAQ